jgi:hypothetical protein
MSVAEFGSNELTAAARQRHFQLHAIDEGAAL